MKAVYDQIRKSSSSVEVLLNFNSATFMRWALAALRRHQGIPVATEDEALDQIEDQPSEPVELIQLDAIAGGDYWKAIALEPALDFPQKLDRFTRKYTERMLSAFTYAAACDIKAKYHHTVPKYHLIYATRHPDGLEIINDAMFKARREFLGSEFRSGMLFDLTPEEEVPNLLALRSSLLALMPEGETLSRHSLRLEGVRSPFWEIRDQGLQYSDHRIAENRQVTQ